MNRHEKTRAYGDTKPAVASLQIRFERDGECR